MHKRDLFSIIIIVGFILNLFSLLSINIIINSIEINVSTASISNSLEVIKIFLQLFFTIPFFIIILIYFKKDKNLTYFAILVLISRLFMNINVAMITMSIENGLNQTLLILSSMAAIGSVITAFRIIILDEYDKKIAKFILFISIYYLAYESGIAPPIIYISSSIFGYIPFFIILFLLNIGLMIVEFMGIKILYNHNLRVKEKPNTEIVYAMDAIKKLREERTTE